MNGFNAVVHKEPVAAKVIAPVAKVLAPAAYKVAAPVYPAPAYLGHPGPVIAKAPYPSPYYG